MKKKRPDNIVWDEKTEKYNISITLSSNVGVLHSSRKYRYCKIPRKNELKNLSRKI